MASLLGDTVPGRISVILCILADVHLSGFSFLVGVFIVCTLIVAALANLAAVRAGRIAKGSETRQREQPTCRTRAGCIRSGSQRSLENPCFC